MAVCGFMNTGGNLGGIIGIPIVAYFSGLHAWHTAFFIGAGFAVVERGLLARHPRKRVSRRPRPRSHRKRRAREDGARHRRGARRRVRRRVAAGSARISRRLVGCQTARCASAAIAGRGRASARDQRRCGLGVLRARTRRGGRARLRRARCAGQQRRHQSDRSRRADLGGAMAAGDERQSLRTVSAVQILGRANVVPRLRQYRQRRLGRRTRRGSLIAARTTPPSTVSSA